MTSAQHLVLKSNRPGWSSTRVLVLSVLLLGPSLACAGGRPNVDSRVVPYEVIGATISEIQRSMASASPNREGGTYFAGATVWDLDATYDLVPAKPGCIFGQAEVDLTIRVHLPVLVSPATPEAVRIEWARFKRALIAHEALHQQNAYRAATELISKLSNVRTELDCETARAVADRATKALVDKISAYDEVLDRRTRHGATQGVYLNLKADGKH